MSRSKDRAIWCMALAQTLVWAGLLYLFPALLVRWEQDLGWSKGDLTGAITVALFLSAFTSPLVGRIIDQGRGHVLMTGSALSGGVGLIALSFVTELWQFYAAWGFIGICTAGCLYEPCFALITRARGESAKQSIILITLVAGFASSISFPLAHSLSEAVNWQFTVRVFAIVILVVATPLMWLGSRRLELTGEGRIHEPVPVLTGRHEFLASPVFWLLGLAFALGAVLHGITLHHLLPILHQRDIHPEVAVIAASFIGPMQVAGRLAMMAAERHVSNHGVAIACFVMLGSSIVLLAGSASTPAMLVGFVILFGGAYGTVSIIRPVLAREVLGSRYFGAKTGALALLYLVGAASAPSLGSLIWALGGYELVLMILVALAALALTLYLLARKLD